jgi:coenzyme F420 hydrogenase subunit beta
METNLNSRNFFLKLPMPMGPKMQEKSIPPKKLSFEESLLENVLLREICSGCGACILVCPFACLGYDRDKPNLVKKCEICGICAKTCPRYEFSQQALEGLVFGRERKPEEEFGVYKSLVIAQATDSGIQRICQDGGVVSALLVFALSNDLIDGAVTSAVSGEKPLFPVPRLALSTQEILECAGTRYTYSPNQLALQEAVKLKKKSLAFVGTPCQIQAVRKIEAAPLKKYSSILRFTIGLMCTESFTYEGLITKHIQGILGINPTDIKKLNIKGKVLITTKSGETKTISLAEAKQYTRKGCLPCNDFSAELADISTGGLGLTDWTFAVIRTQRGEEIFKGAQKAGAIRTKPVEEEKAALDLLVKLSRKKRKLV